MIQQTDKIRSHTFRVADLFIKIVFETTEETNTLLLLPSFQPFVHEEATSDYLFQLTVTDTLQLPEDMEEIGCFDTGNGDIIVYQSTDGCYHFIFKDIYGKKCSTLMTSKDYSQCRCAMKGDESMRTFGLNNALMLLFTIAGYSHQALLIHASCVVCDDKAYPFIAKSGTGKSTHSQLWLKNIENTHLLNDDNPIVRIIGDTVWIYGSPWSGKTPCYRQCRYPAGAIVKISRAKTNSIERMNVIQSFALLLPACSSMKFDETLYNIMCNTIGKVMAQTPVYTMHCLPDDEAALICHNTITRN